jgi:nitroimidazol reductase NimA-like FMN-containing flavoprotein (pyridoxamine 5'-phosphate oxidase superfamily)
MAEREPRATTSMAGEAATTLPWSEARDRLAQTRFYWVATTRPDGRPHVRPVLGVWVEGAMYSTTGPNTRKAANLAHDPRCAITARTDGMDLVLEGDASFVRDDDTLRKVAKAYDEKYGWPVTIQDGAYDAPYGAPTAGPPPYELYRITPTVVLGFGTDETYAPRSTRFRF